MLTIAPMVFTSVSVWW